MPAAESEGAAPNDQLRRAVALVFVDDIEHPVLREEDRHHLVDVLRPRLGERLALGDGAGAWRSAEIVSLTTTGRRSGRGQSEGTGVELLCAAEVLRVEPPPPPLTVAFAIPKGDRLELVVQKLTELGIDRIVPLLTRRTVVRLSSVEAARRRERLVRVAREASAQSRRLTLPVVAEPQTLLQFLATDANGIAIAEPGGSPIDGRVHGVVIGPEGGWAEEELAAFPRRVGLGPTVLRAETAAIAAGAILAAIRSDLVRHG